MWFGGGSVPRCAIKVTLTKVGVNTAWLTRPHVHAHGRRETLDGLQQTAEAHTRLFNTIEKGKEGRVRVRPVGVSRGASPTQDLVAVKVKMLW